ncbi:hypothetical protein DL764_001624 [Monosporascus ibericus]|uniref:Uncharacterized protein n=1 Tax=Monosporascus ibericus TaxID=155417 RepID=A0A4Q4TS16_9PEZI|nr:hypothetical protein DL764_001624 [Monosporascus ibericus]
MAPTVSNVNSERGFHKFLVGGEGNYDDPKVEWRLLRAAYRKLCPDRRRGCEAVAKAVTVALSLTNIEIRAWNHDTQYVYDTQGRKVYYIDEDGKRRPKLERADSHMTARIWDAANPERDYHAHIYTVDDDRQVPQRLMLIGERQYIRAHDRQSPQLWPHVSRGWQGENPPKDALEEFVRSQWIDELILFDVDQKLDLKEWDKTCRQKQVGKEGTLAAEAVLTPNQLQRLLESCGFYG